MAFQAGEVVVLKSGGVQMTVADVSDDGVLCLWLGEEGELFRETLPVSVLEAVAADDDEDEEEGDEADDEEDEDGKDGEDDDEDEDEEKKSAARKVA